jgi:hypothetical protein
MQICFKKLKQFGRWDYRPLDARAEALCNLKGHVLQQADIMGLLAAGFDITISE